MDASSGILLAYIVSIFLYIVQIVRISCRNIVKLGDKPQQALWTLLVGSILLSVALVAVSATTRKDSPAACSAEELGLNPDIGGIGVLMGLFLPCLPLVLILCLGHWRAETFGVKELCIAQLASMRDYVPFRGDMRAKF